MAGRRYIQRANDQREITGEGFTFLNIPRTYYGLLDKSLLIKGGVDGEARQLDSTSRPTCKLAAAAT